MTRQPMSCQEVLQQLFAFLDRELDETTWTEVEHHLERCRGCFSRADFERALRARVREAGESAAPARLRARIRQLIESF